MNDIVLDFGVPPTIQFALNAAELLSLRCRDYIVTFESHCSFIMNVPDKNSCRFPLPPRRSIGNSPRNLLSAELLQKQCECIPNNANAGVGNRPPPIRTEVASLFLQLSRGNTRIRQCNSNMPNSLNERSQFRASYLCHLPPCLVSCRCQILQPLLEATSFDRFFH
jgi:hypothetical protein